MMRSFLEATARERIAALCDCGSWREIAPPSARLTSPHLPQLGAPLAFDDGCVIGRARLEGQKILIAAQEGGFMGGAIGEVHGAKLTGLLRLAARDKPQAVLLLLESGGVRLHEANAGLLAVAEVLRALLDARAAGVPVLVLLGGANGCYGGAGIIARCANWIVMSEQARLAMSGPEVIESVRGVEEFDARDRALVWRVAGGKHRYLLGEAEALVEDDMHAFRAAACAGLASSASAALDLSRLQREQAQLQQRLQDFAACSDPEQIWRALGLQQDNLREQVALADAAQICAWRAALPAREGV
ncbi:biotin-independent malonate decarboxylase subunit beta [Massilia sp. W12]|uniref:biotin-independent malonate decarboxylase subunit beta n=1 Tax=Massilia sp. W12 TaxID=3126507 RepID=UPI0030D10629